MYYVCNFAAKVASKKMMREMPGVSRGDRQLFDAEWSARAERILASEGQTREACPTDLWSNILCRATIGAAEHMHWSPYPIPVSDDHPACPGEHGLQCADQARCEVNAEHQHWGGRGNAARPYAQLCTACVAHNDRLCAARRLRRVR